MTTPQRITLLCSLFVSGLSGCGPEVEDSPQLFERRRPACEQWCDVFTDPDCGSIERAFEDTTECVELCMSEEAFNWGLQEDGTDACFDELSGFYACVADATCEEQWIATNDPASLHMMTCGPSLETFFDCNGS